MTETIAALVAAHAGGKRIIAIVEETYARIAAHNDPALFITLRPKAEALADAARLEAEGPAGKPLYGVPFAVKDNIDVAGLPTTAACPAFAYQPERSAFVARWRDRRQDEPRPVRDRPRRRVLAPRRALQRLAPRPDPRRVESPPAPAAGSAPGDGPPWHAPPTAPRPTRLRPVGPDAVGERRLCVQSVSILIALARLRRIRLNA